MYWNDINMFDDTSDMILKNIKRRKDIRETYGEELYQIVEYYQEIKNNININSIFYKLNTIDNFNIEFCQYLYETYDIDYSNLKISLHELSNMVLSKYNLDTLTCLIMELNIKYSEVKYIGTSRKDRFIVELMNGKVEVVDITELYIKYEKITFEIADENNSYLDPTSEEIRKLFNIKTLLIKKNNRVINIIDIYNGNIKTINSYTEVLRETEYEKMLVDKLPNVIIAKDKTPIDKFDDTNYKLADRKVNGKHFLSRKRYEFRGIGSRYVI